MIGRWVTGAGFWLAVGLLSMAIVGLGVFVLAAVVVPEANRTLAVVERPSPSASRSAPSPATVGPMHIPIPASAQCTACHGSGDPAAVLDIPAIAHPVKGWSDCTACHADDRLVTTAPGHSGLDKDLCLSCHKERAPNASGSALPRPHHIVAGAACISCHGSKAPLPTDMAGRTNCWICHPDQETTGLFGSPAPSRPPTPSASAGKTD